jgi:putative acetyltransferase
MDIRQDPLLDPRVHQFLEEHLRDMHAVSPPESTHALDLEGLRHPDVMFWTAWNAEVLLGTGALKRLDSTHAEVKSMRTAVEARGQGVAGKLLDTMINEARSRGIRRLSLETGSMGFFEPARQLYLSRNFVFCEPFGEYCLDPNSVFMTRSI